MLSKKQQQKLCIGPLVLKSNTPLNIYNCLSNGLIYEVNNINGKKATQLAFSNGRFNRHIQAIKDCIQWLQKYQLQSLYILKCPNNSLPTLKYINIFYMPRLEQLYLNDCKIESIDLLVESFFPNLMFLVLYNNYITSLKPLRKCWIPLLCQLILDSNNISDLTPLYQIIGGRLQRLQVQNNRTVDVRSLFKLNFASLQNLRYQCEVLIEWGGKNIVNSQFKKKFPIIESGQ